MEDNSTAIIRFLVGLVPQKDDDMTQIYAWRWKSVLLGGCTLILALYASDLVPLVPPPYAMAAAVENMQGSFQTRLAETNTKIDNLSSEMVDVQARLKDSQVHEVNNDLLDARRYQCRAIESNDKSALPFWNNRLELLKLQYQRLTGEVWPEPQCNSF